jgi:pilus assembly protein CpaB
MTRRIIAVAAALVLAVLGGALVISYATTADQRAIANAEPRRVWVSEQVVPVGTTLKDAQRTDLISEATVPAGAMPTGALTEITPENSSLLALSDIQPGEYLLDARFGTTPAGEKAIEVPSGMLAVSVELNDPARVGKFVTPGSQIAVYSSYRIKALGNDERSRLINGNDVKGTSVLLDDVQVIGMGDSALMAPPGDTDQETQRQSPSFLVTVAVTPKQANRLIHGINEYTLYAALRGSDVKIDPKAQVNDLTIFEEARS